MLPQKLPVTAGFIVCGSLVANQSLGLLPSFTHVTKRLCSLLTHASAASVRLETAFGQIKFACSDVVATLHSWHQR